MAIIPFSAKIIGSVDIADNVIIGEYCVLGSHHGRLVIGDGSVIRSHSVIYGGSDFSGGITTGHYALIRDGVKAGRGLQIGTRSTVEGHCEFGDWVRVNTCALISPGCAVDDLAWIYANVVLCNDPTPPSHQRAGVYVGKMAVVATGSTVLPGVRVGMGAMVAAGSMVNHDVADATVAMGVPARRVCTLRQLNMVPGRLRYPWSTHFADAYPAEAQALIRRIGEEIGDVIQKR